MTGQQRASWLITLDNSAARLLVLTVAAAANISYRKFDFHQWHVYCQSLLFIAAGEV